MSSHVGIIGGGVAGLSAGTHLANEGYRVTLLERNDQLGGRARTLERDGFRFDMGPSWYLMPDVFERYFDRFGRHPEEFYDLTRLDPNYRAIFKDGTRIDVPADPDELAAVFESYESTAGRALERYLTRAEDAYETGMAEFVYTDRGRFRDYLDPRMVLHARGLRLFASMEGHVSRYFSHPKLRQLVQYNLVFLGGSPSTTPALYSLMAHVDFNLGVYYPEGGIAGVIDALVSLAIDEGVEVRTGVEATSIDGERGDFSITAGEEETLACDLVISAADLAHTELELLDRSQRHYDRSYWRSRTLAPSAFMLYLGIEGDLDALEHHTLVLPTDWDPHFESIFDDPRWPKDPAYYVCRPSATDPTVAPPGHEAMFVLVPVAPGLSDEPTIRERYRETVLSDLERQLQTDLTDRIVTEESFCVSEFAAEYNAYQGTALGLAHTLRQTGPLRPDHRAKGVDGLYYTGSYTRPGIGLPMALISGEHTAEAIFDDRA